MLKWRIAEPKDAYWIHKMRHDDTIRLNLTTSDRYSEDQCRNWLETLPHTSQRVVIIDEADKNVGLFRIDRINYRYQNCLFGLDILEEHRGNGHSYTIWNMMMKEWFLNMNMETIYSEVLEVNNIARRVYKKLGFQKDGKWRNAVYRNGYWVDLITMSITKAEFLNILYKDCEIGYLQTR